MKEEINAIMAEMAEEARELLEEAKEDEERGEVLIELAEYRGVK